MSTLPTRSKSAGTDKKNNLLLSLRPCQDTNGEKVWYRFRLLAFNSPSKSDRDYPFIERYVHQIFEKNDKGYSVLKDEITCPVTHWVNFEGNRYDGCPMCKLANQYFCSYKESGWKDRNAWKQQHTIGRKYQAIIPVYVVNDPNYPSNNGKFKVIIFNDKKFYNEFCEKIKKASLTNCVFNAENAVDCCIHMTETETLMNEGQPNQYMYKQRIIDKITFSAKPYTIDAITKDRVENMGFDENYYVSATLDELHQFYNKHFKISNDDIPDDDDVSTNVFIEKKTTPSTKNNVTKSKPVVSNPTSDDLTENLDDITDSIDDITDNDPDDLPVTTKSENNDVDDVDIEELLGEFDF